MGANHEKIIALLLATTTVLTAGLAIAGGKEQALIDKVVTAYGGDAIKNLTSYSTFDEFLGPSLGQSYSHDLEHVQSIIQGVSHDIVNQRATFDSIFEGRGGIFQNATIINGETAWNINYQQQTYGDAQNADIYALAGGTMRTNDALLAYELWRHREDTEHLGEDVHLGTPVEKIKTPFPQSPDLTIWVNADNGRIVRMIRENPQLGRLDYTFSDWQTVDGIPYATRTHFYIAGRPNLITTSKSVRFNQPMSDGMFELPAGITQEPERIDTSEMSARKFSDDVFHIGQGGAFSLFVSTTDGLVGVGTIAGLNARLEHYRNETGDHRPLSFQVVTHHHSDHVPGVADAVAAGAKIVTVEATQAAISEFVAEYDDSTYLNVEGRLTLGTGKSRIDLFEVDTLHAESYLVVYLPGEKLMFMADHMNSPYVSGTPVANANTVSMMAALQPLDLNVKEIVVSHGARVFKWQDFVDAVDAYEPAKCGGNRPVCQ